MDNFDSVTDMTPLQLAIEWALKAEQQLRSTVQPPSWKDSEAMADMWANIHLAAASDFDPARPNYPRVVSVSDLV